MRLLLISDIHANLEAFEACLAAAPEYDYVVNLGDVVGYNASPNEVCARVIAMNAPIVRGNHDRACAGLSDLKEFNPVAAISAHWTKNTLAPKHLEWLSALPKGPIQVPHLPGMEFVHGAPLDEDEYLLNTAAADDNLELPGHAPLIFFGHTHIQGGYTLRNDKMGVLQLKPTGGNPFSRLTIEESTTYLLNPGSIGQPRDGDPRAAFAIASLEEHTVEFWRIAYDIEAVQSRMTRAGLPEPLALRLSFGR